MSTTTKTLSKGTIYQALTAPEDGYLLVELNGSNLTGKVDIHFQQSVSGDNWDTIEDLNDKDIVVRLDGAKNASITKVKLFESFRAGHLRAKIISESTGSLQFVLP